MFKLQNKVEIIIPKEDNVGRFIGDERITEARKTITKICGGCTVTETIGQWYAGNERPIMQDENFNYEWYYNKDMQDVNKQHDFLQGLSTIARILITEYNQEAISIKVNGVLYIVDHSDIEELQTTLLSIMKNV